MTSNRRLVALGALVALSAIAAGVWGRPRSPGELRVAAVEMLNHVRLSTTVVSSTLAATGAIADFGLDEGIRLVNVRILDELALELRIDTDRDVTLDGPPVVCLVGPYWAPDDAGLSDRCWGEPDLEELVANALAVDASGHPRLEAGRPVVLTASLWRGHERCDYPPGKWQLEVTADPLVDGSSVAGIELAPVSFTVPLETGGSLPFYGVADTRYCGLASAVYREQGEPPILTP